jgi:hypothetical protein
MNISHRLIRLGLAFSLLGSTAAFAKPTPNTVESHVPIPKTSGVTGYASRPSANTVKDDWPNNMLPGAADD